MNGEIPDVRSGFPFTDPVPRRTQPSLGRGGILKVVGRDSEEFICMLVSVFVYEQYVFVELL